MFELINVEIFRSIFFETMKKWTILQLFCFFIFPCSIIGFTKAQVPLQINLAATERKPQDSHEFANDFVGKVVVCHRRYRNCSERFSPAFCIAPNQKFAFYIWARRAARNIMVGKYDVHENVTCSEGFLKYIIHGPLSLLVNFSAQLQSQKQQQQQQRLVYM